MAETSNRTVKFPHSLRFGSVALPLKDKDFQLVAFKSGDVGIMVVVKVAQEQIGGDVAVVDAAVSSGYQTEIVGGEVDIGMSQTKR